jgi:hypothetical protein
MSILERPLRKITSTGIRTTLKRKSYNNIANPRKNHSPTLRTIRMVENIIRENGYFDSKNKLSRSLNKQIQSNTLLEVLNYLKESNKITVDKVGTIVWIFEDKEKIKKSLKNSKKLE